MLRPPQWMRTFGVALLGGLWLAMLSPIVLAIREGDWMAPVRDSNLGPAGAVVGWLVLGVFILFLPPAILILRKVATVLDLQGVEPSFGRPRVELAHLGSVRWTPQGGPVNAANRPARIEVTDEKGHLVARVDRTDPHWEPAVALFQNWVVRHPNLLAPQDDATRQLLAPPLGG